MYEKKDIIVSSTMGLCVVSDVTKLSADKKTPIPYYVLKSYYDKNKVAYIPVENHEVELRDVMSEEEANKKLELLTVAYSENKDFTPDELEVGEVAFVLKLSIEELLEKAGKVTEE